MLFIKGKNWKALAHGLAEELEEANRWLSEYKHNNRGLNNVLTIERNKRKGAERAVEIYRKDVIELEKKYEKVLEELNGIKKAPKFDEVFPPQVDRIEWYEIGRAIATDINKYGDEAWDYWHRKTCKSDMVINNISRFEYNGKQRTRVTLIARVPRSEFNNEYIDCLDYSEKEK